MHPTLITLPLMYVALGGSVVLGHLAMSTKKVFLIEGFRPDELPEALGPELQREILAGRPLVARAGTSEVLMSLELRNGVLRVELVHVDGGGEGLAVTY